MAEVPYCRDDLQEDFGEDHGGPHVEIHAAVVQVLGHRTQEAKIVMARLADRSAHSGWMDVRSVRADGYVNRYGHSGAVGFVEQAGGRETAVGDTLETAAERFAESDFAGAFVDRFVHLAPR